MSLACVPTQADILCFSHLRWDFVYQRPQHLLSRLARHHRVYYVEEPVPTSREPHLSLCEAAPGVQVVVPHLPKAECAPGHAGGEAHQRLLLDELVARERIDAPVRWYYTPMSWAFSQHIAAGLVVYDCMDELTGFLHAPRELVAREKSLLAEADLVFTGGFSLYEAKRRSHPQVHAFPSSVDAAHFAQARRGGPEPADLAGIAAPRIGFFGVIDERLDIALLAAAADARPEWQWVLLGPVTKIDPASLPRRPNLHYLGGKRYEQLPGYLAGWDAAVMPFALNASTRFISPTKTPEYLAGGCPVVSTPITDVVRGYGASGLVRIADGPEAFVAALEATLAERAARTAGFCEQVDALLDGMSWDITCAAMLALMAERHAQRGTAAREPSRTHGLPAAEAAWTA